MVVGFAMSRLLQRACHGSRGYSRAGAYYAPARPSQPPSTGRAVVTAGSVLRELRGLAVEMVHPDRGGPLEHPRPAGVDRPCVIEGRPVGEPPRRTLRHQPRHLPEPLMGRRVGDVFGMTVAGIGE